MSDSWDPQPSADAADDWGNNGADDFGEAEAKPAPPPLPFEHREGPIAEWEKTTAYNYDAPNDSDDWDGNAQVYFWDGEVGDVGPEHPELEKALFGEERLDNEPIDFSRQV